MKHKNLLNEKNYDFYLISNHFSLTKKFKKIKLKQAKTIMFDLTFICCPANKKSFFIKQLIDNSKKIFLEKPVAINTKIPKNLSNTENQKKKKYEGYVFRHNTIINNIKKKITDRKKNGKLIGVQFINRSYLPNWRKHIIYSKSVSSIKSKGGGVLLELSHEVDLAFYFFGKLKVKKSLLTNSKTLKINVEERADVIFQVKNTVPINMVLDFNSKLVERKIIINFSKINYIIDLNNNYLKIINNFKKSKIIKFKNANVQMFRNQMRFFLKRKSFGNSYKNGIYVLKVIEKLKNVKQ